MQQNHPLKPEDTKVIISNYSEAKLYRDIGQGGAFAFCTGVFKLKNYLEKYNLISKTTLYLTHILSYRNK